MKRSFVLFLFFLIASFISSFFISFINDESVNESYAAYNSLNTGAQVDAAIDHYQMKYYPDPAESDQGVTASGSGDTIYDILQTVGTSKYATIVLAHTGSGNTTNYTLDTSINLTTYPYVFILPEPGARLVRTTGDEIFTPYSPENLIVGKTQQITAVDMIDFAVGGTVYPEWWGANTTPGTTDMTIALQAAFDNGRYISLKPYVYAVSSPLDIDTNSEVTIFGQNWDSKIKTLSSFSGQAILKVNNVDKITIKDLYVEGISSGAYSDYVSGIRTYDGVDDLLIEHVKITNTRLDGIRIDTPTSGLNYRVKIKNCHIEDVGWVGITLYDTTNLIVFDNYVSECGWDCIFIGEDITDAIVSHNYVTKATAPTYIYDGPGGNGGVEKGFLISYQPDAINIKICDNVCINNTTAGEDGIGIQNEDQNGTLCKNVIISNNIVQDAGQYGIDCLSNMVVSGNIIHGCAATGIMITLDTGGTIRNLVVSGNSIRNITGTAYGIHIQTPSVSGSLITKNIVISGNSIFDDQGSPTTDYGFGYNTDVDLINILVGSNNFAGTNSSCLRYGGGGGANEKVEISNNFSKNELPTIASASTLTLNIDTDFFTISGTTTIGTITNSWIGRIVTLYFDGILTVQHATGNIRLNGSSNFTTAQGSKLLLIHNGSLWFELARTNPS